MTDEQRIKLALDLIQEAQNLVGSAAQQLCPIQGGANVWSATLKVHDQIKRHWYRVDAFRHKLRNESQPTAVSDPIGANP